MLRSLWSMYASGCVRFAADILRYSSMEDISRGIAARIACRGSRAPKTRSAAQYCRVSGFLSHRKKHDG
jgi:hypothetical protein